LPAPLCDYRPFGQVEIANAAHNELKKIFFQNGMLVAGKHFNNLPRSFGRGWSD
jgi:hypothetical protein